MSRNTTELREWMEIFLCFDLGGGYPGTDIHLIFTKLHTLKNMHFTLCKLHLTYKKEKKTASCLRGLIELRGGKEKKENSNNITLQDTWIWYYLP